MCFCVSRACLDWVSTTKGVKNCGVLFVHSLYSTLPRCTRLYTGTGPRGTRKVLTSSALGSAWSISQSQLSQASRWSAGSCSYVDLTHFSFSIPLNPQIQLAAGFSSPAPLPLSLALTLYHHHHSCPFFFMAPHSCFSFFFLSLHVLSISHDLIGSPSFISLLLTHLSL